VGVFIALLVSLSPGKADLLPWGLASVVAIAAERWLPGNWYVLLGAAAGSLPGLVGLSRE
jgi:predicted branched-subunit amino acid permease